MKKPPKAFKLIPGFPGYCISRSGIVLGCKIASGRVGSWRKKSVRPGRNGRLQFWGSRDGRQFGMQVHRALLLAYVGPCPSGKEGCHNNDDHLDNRISNLRWDTHSANMVDAVSKFSKLTKDAVIAIRQAVASGSKSVVVAEQFSISYQQVRRIVNRERWAHT